MIQKIISGGQTGVDQAALHVAITLGIECGGWCPPGRVCENGQIPFYYPLKETLAERSLNAPDVPRSQRTEWNVCEAEATLILKPANMETDKGTEWTIQCAINYKRPYLIINPFEKDAAFKVRAWLAFLKIRTLNVAGPSENTFPGITRQTKKLLCLVFSPLSPELTNK